MGLRERTGGWYAALLLLLLLAGCSGNPTGDPVRFTVPRGAGLASVTDTLASRGVVEWPAVFQLYARFKGVAGSIKPGIYEMQRGTGWAAVLDRLVEGDVVTLTVVVPEGWSLSQVAPRLAAAAGVPADSVLQNMLDPATSDALGVPGPTLEGYVYPATYVFPVGTPPGEMVAAMVRRYQRVWTPALRARADSLGLDEREVVTLASIVEKEAKRWEERDTIAAVYLNRLRIGMPLQADPTVQYALGEHQTRLLYSHIDDVADHPYNTYTNRGLPPGPIGSPSEGAIEATLDPADAPDLLYFVAEADGSHVFTRSLAEHNAARARIRREQAAAQAAAQAGR